MDLQVIINLSDDLIGSKSVVERIVDINVNQKLDSYLNKYKKDDAKWEIKIIIEKNKKELFDWKINASFDWDNYFSEREDYKNLDDLINNLFNHIKEQLSDKK